MTVKKTIDQGVIVAPIENETPGPWTAAEFFALFTAEEVGTFYARIDAGDVGLRLTRDMIMATSTPLAYDNPLVQGGLFALQQSGVITAERVAEILGTA